MDQSLGKFTKLNVRTYWPDEAADFTPWLAHEENILRLSESLGIELEIESTEVDVGPYSADILARDSASSDFVVIENQLGKTDHDHIGKAITYAAVLDASAIVWIAPEFTEEHKKTLDWLNDNSSEDVSFFGVRLELWRIDDSKPAVQFNVVSRPADFARKSTLTKAAGPLTEVKKLQLEWWTAFRKALLDKSVLPSARKARPQYWYDVALGRSGIHLSNTANTYDKKIGVRVYLSNRYNSEVALSQLLDQKDEIENEIGEQLLWDANPEARDKIIAIYLKADISQRDKWEEYIGWMVDITGRFRNAFSPRIKLLDLDIVEEED